MNTLLTFTGFRDPYDSGLIEGEEVMGPILTLLKAREFGRIYLFSTPNTKRNTVETVETLNAHYSSLELNIIELELSDPTDYLEILRSLRSHLVSILEKTGDDPVYISVSSGTPQMHACWLLLAAGGEIPAHIINVRPPRFVTREHPLVAEINFASHEFPTIRSKSGPIESCNAEPSDLQSFIIRMGIVGDHPSMKKVLETCAALSESDLPILILGESGTGKELIARLIHHLSRRPPERFVPLNCAAIPKDLFESILYGHRKGAFTGASQDQKGKFDHADGGTLFLDEIGELPCTIQPKLLRTLQDGYIEAIGAMKPHKVNVRIIAATNLNLKKAIKTGTFREDLFFRLSVGIINVPSLRERRSDIPKIALHVLDRVNERLKRAKRFSTGSLKVLQSHPWPGNVREMENAIERTARLVKKDIIEPEDIEFLDSIDATESQSSLPEPDEGFSLDEYMVDLRRKLINRALEIAQGNQSRAARLLGITPQAVSKFLKTQE
ncbi:MAG: sigma 54-interacting transcriptional regulator [Candidatus Xenobiia bacterium LiM19]